jgi:uridine kinase
MIHDIIKIKPHHYETAKQILPYLLPEMLASNEKFCISIAGESGSGKSVAAICLRELLSQEGIRTLAFHQDDYFYYPPVSNHQKRVENIGWVGTNEVNFPLLQAHVDAFKAGISIVEKPLVHYKDNLIHQETITLSNVQVLIVEGTYTSLLESLDKRIFMSRNYHETYEQRMSRGRDIMNEFVEQVLEIEHNIISKHKTLADILVDKNYNVALNS